jgi:putative acetyltransferase
MSWQIFECELDHEDVRALLEQHFAEMRSGSPPEACHVLPLESLQVPKIRFFTIREMGKLLGCGALKRFQADHGEIKSMRTADFALGRGIGSAMLNHIIEVARGDRITKLSLETGSTDQFAAANRLYAKAGFERTGPFGDYADTPFTRFFTRKT